MKVVCILVLIDAISFTSIVVFKYEVGEKEIKAFLTYEYCMPSVTFYIPTPLYLKLCKEPSPSKFIQRLLDEYYHTLEKKVEEQKPESPKTGNSDSKGDS